MPPETANPEAEIENPDNGGASDNAPIEDADALMEALVIDGDDADDKDDGADKDGDDDDTTDDDKEDKDGTDDKDKDGDDKEGDDEDKEDDDGDDDKDKDGDKDADADGDDEENFDDVEFNIGTEEKPEIVKGAEMRAGYMRQKDYTQKTMGLATQAKETQKAAGEYLGMLKNAVQKYAAAPPEMPDIKNYVGADGKTDSEKFAADTVLYQNYMTLHEASKEDMKHIEQELKNNQAQELWADVKTLIPEWADDQLAVDDLNSMADVILKIAGVDATKDNVMSAFPTPISVLTARELWKKTLVADKVAKKSHVLKRAKPKQTTLKTKTQPQTKSKDAKRSEITNKTGEIGADEIMDFLQT